MTRRFHVVSAFLALLLAHAPAVAAEPESPAANAFFAMDTAARGGPETVVPLLKELGYDGLGGKAGDVVMPDGLQREGLRFFNAYHVQAFEVETAMPDASMKRFIEVLAGRDAALWLAISKVQRSGQAPASGDAEADAAVVEKLRALADYAEPRGVKIALYPHAGFWLDRFEHGQRLAERADRKSVGVTFNLCHWLRVEGSQRDPGSVIAAALARLMFVTINGADTGETQRLGWDRLIQPLGRGSYDVPGFLAKLRSAGYRGPIGFQGYGIKMEPRELLTITMRAWREMQPATREPATTAPTPPQP